jgi:hypothetical protein
MERICSVCGGAKKDLFSSTYCPRCEETAAMPAAMPAAMSFANVDSAAEYIRFVTGWTQVVGRYAGNWSIRVFVGPNPFLPPVEIVFTEGPVPCGYVTSFVDTIKGMRP